MVSGGVREGGVGDGVPWQLPATRPLVGRHAELSVLEGLRQRAARAGMPAVVVISGLGGVGESTLSVAWLRALRTTLPDGALYADLGGQWPVGPAEPFQVLGGFLRALGVRPDRIPHATHERAALYRSLTAGRRLVVLLDDARSAAQVRPLLPSGPNVAVVTSRNRLPGLAVDGCVPLPLRPLSTAAAGELLAGMVPHRLTAADDQVRALARLCSGLPLAVRLAGGLLASAAPATSPAAAVRALARERARLEGLPVPPEYPVWAALDVVYRALPGAVTRLYRLLSLHPGPDFGVEVALAALGGTESRTEAAALLSRLCRARLLEATGEPGAARYRFHPLVRLHATARAQLETGDGERVAAIHRIFDHFLATASYAESLLSSHHLPLHRSYASGTPPVVAPGINGDPERALRWLAAEQANLLAVARQARRLGMPALCWQVADAMWPLFEHRCTYDQARTVYREGLAAARACRDRAAERRMLTLGGLVELGDRRHGRALTVFEEAARCCRRHGDEPGHARTLHYRGSALQRLGRSAEAAELLARAAVECPRCGDRRTGAWARLGLAEVLLGEGRSEEAEAEASLAWRLLRELGDDAAAARAAALLGHARLARGRTRAAESLLRDAVRQLGAVGAEREEARAWQALADIARRRGRWDLARRRWRRALALYAALGPPSAAEDVRARLAVDPALGFGDGRTAAGPAPDGEPPAH